MGLRINLNDANWVAALLQPDEPLPSLESLGTTWRDQQRRLHDLLAALQSGFISTQSQMASFAREVSSLSFLLNSRSNVEELMMVLRQRLANRPWTALIVPSERSTSLDIELASS